MAKRDPHLLKEVRILEELKVVEVLMQLLLDRLTLTMVGNPCSHYALLALFSSAIFFLDMPVVTYLLSHISC